MRLSDQCVLDLLFCRLLRRRLRRQFMRAPNDGCNLAAFFIGQVILAVGFTVCEKALRRQNRHAAGKLHHLVVAGFDVRFVILQQCTVIGAAPVCRIRREEFHRGAQAIQLQRLATVLCEDHAGKRQVFHQRLLDAVQKQKHRIRVCRTGKRIGCAFVIDKRQCGFRQIDARHAAQNFDFVDVAVPPGQCRQPLQQHSCIDCSRAGQIVYVGLFLIEYDIELCFAFRRRRLGYRRRCIRQGRRCRSGRRRLR